MSSLAALFGHWAIVSASCATGFTITAEELTLHTPMGFENLDLPPKHFDAESVQEEGMFTIVYTQKDGTEATMRFTVKDEYLVDDAGYEYRRCSPQAIG